jgi:hypothetical protein
MNGGAPIGRICTMLIEISIGEGLDRLSILEIKEREITDPGRLVEIRKEIASLGAFQPYKERFSYYYKLILLVNKRIWDLTNRIKAMVCRDAAFAEVAYEIFELNQARFRVKNVLNEMTHDGIKEQKSYGRTEVSVVLSSETEEVGRLLAYLSLSYDSVQIVCNEAVRDAVCETVPSFHYTFVSDCSGISSAEVLVPAWFILA